MLECNRNVKKKLTKLSRAALLILPVLCVVMLLSQTALAKSTYLINDGDRVLLHSTYATDPAAILSEAGLTLGEDDTYTTEEGLGLSEITVQRSQLVTVVQGSKSLEVITYGESVQELLSRLGIVLTEADVLSVPADSQTDDGMVITISRTLRREETYSKSIPYSTVYCYDASLAEGEEVVLTAGVDGQLLCTASVSYVDGEEVSRVMLTEEVVRQPVDAVIAIGTYTAQPEQSTMPTDPPATEPPVTLPEASDVPVISDGVITTPDGQVLTYTGSMQVVATAYNSSDPGCTIYTYMGTLCRVGAIAVDPSVIPLGTRMYIVSNDGQYIYGVAVAEDIGGSIKGNKIDLYFDSVAECNSFGIRGCTVYFLG